MAFFTINSFVKVQGLQKVEEAPTMTVTTRWVYLKREATFLDRAPVLKEVITEAGKRATIMGVDAEWRTRSISTTLKGGHGSPYVEFKFRVLTFQGLEYSLDLVKVPLPRFHTFEVSKKGQTKNTCR